MGSSWGCPFACAGIDSWKFCHKECRVSIAASLCKGLKLLCLVMVLWKLSNLCLLCFKYFLSYQAYTIQFSFNFLGFFGFFSKRFGFDFRKCSLKHTSLLMRIIIPSFHHKQLLILLCCFSWSPPFYLSMQHSKQRLFPNSSLSFSLCLFISQCRSVWAE